MEKIVQAKTGILFICSVYKGVYPQNILKIAGSKRLNLS